MYTTDLTLNISIDLTLDIYIYRSNSSSNLIKHQFSEEFTNIETIFPLQSEDILFVKKIEMILINLY